MKPHPLELNKRWGCFMDKQKNCNETFYCKYEQTADQFYTKLNIKIYINNYQNKFKLAQKHKCSPVSNRVKSASFKANPIV